MCQKKKNNKKTKKTSTTTTTKKNKKKKIQLIISDKLQLKIFNYDMFICSSRAGW